MLRNVVALIDDSVAAFELGVVCEAFGIDRSDQGLPVMDFDVCSVQPGPVRTAAGYSITTEYAISTREGWDRVAKADLVAVPALDRSRAFDPVLLDALRAAVDRGARVFSVCSGAFALGAAGLLDGRRCTTHWRYADELAARYPEAKVDPTVLYVDDHPIISSAGTAAGIDAALYLWREEYGAEITATVARRMVVPPFREGGQAQFIEAPIRPTRDCPLSATFEYMIQHLDQPLTVDHLAAHAAMSPRTFARRFRAETGTTPYEWLLGHRISAAQQLLERGSASIEQIAEQTGFGTAAGLRHHFANRLGTTPQAYRTTFAAHPS